MNRTEIIDYFRELATAHVDIAHVEPAPGETTQGKKKFFRTSLEELLLGAKMQFSAEGYFLLIGDISLKIIDAKSHKIKVSMVFFVLKSVKSGDANALEEVLDKSFEIINELLNRMLFDDHQNQRDYTIFRKNLPNLKDVPILQARLAPGSSTYHGHQCNLSWIANYTPCYNHTKFNS